MSREEEVAAHAAVVHIGYVAGLVNHSVASGEAHLKALEIARDINQKVWHPVLLFFTCGKCTWKTMV